MHSVSFNKKVRNRFYKIIVILCLAFLIDISSIIINISIIINTPTDDITSIFNSCSNTKDITMILVISIAIISPLLIMIHEIVIGYLRMYIYYLIAIFRRNSYRYILKKTQRITLKVTNSILTLYRSIYNITYLSAKTREK